jgi:excisionase family DNA binding protein
MEEKVNLISAKDAAHRLNISRGMLSRLVSSGRLGVYRIGDRTLFDEQILEEFKAAVFEPPCDNARALAA